MSYFILNQVTINEKRNEVFIRGDYSNVSPRDNCKTEMKGETFADKVKGLARLALSGEIVAGNLSVNMIKYSYAFVMAFRELGITHFVEYLDATPIHKKEIEDKFATHFLKYYFEKEKEGKFAVVMNDMKHSKLAFELTGRYLPREIAFSSYGYTNARSGWKHSNIMFGHKKASVIRSILGSDRFHLEKVE